MADPTHDQPLADIDEAIRRASLALQALDDRPDSDKGDYYLEGARAVLDAVGLPELLARTFELERDLAGALETLADPATDAARLRGQIAAVHTVVERWLTVTDIVAPGAVAMASLTSAAAAILVALGADRAEVETLLARARGAEGGARSHAWAEIASRDAEIIRLAGRIAELEAAATSAPGFTCPRCHRTSHHPEDMRNGYCGACHDYTGADDLSALEALAKAAPPLPWVMPDPDLARYVAAVTAAVPRLIGMVRRLRARLDSEQSAGELGHVVVEFNQASGRPSVADDSIYGLDDAREVAAEARVRTRSVGRRETYAIGVVTLLEDAAGDGR